MWPLLRAQGNRRIKNLRPAQVRVRIKAVEEYRRPSDNRRNYNHRRRNRGLVWCLQRLMAFGRW
jgi:hypothetical protein